MPVRSVVVVVVVVGSKALISAPFQILFRRIALAIGTISAHLKTCLYALASCMQLLRPQSPWTQSAIHAWLGYGSVSHFQMVFGDLDLGMCCWKY